MYKRTLGLLIVGIIITLGFRNTSLLPAAEPEKKPDVKALILQLDPTMDNE